MFFLEIPYRVEELRKKLMVVTPFVFDQRICENWTWKNRWTGMRHIQDPLPGQLQWPLWLHFSTDFYNFGINSRIIYLAIQPSKWLSTSVGKQKNGCAPRKVYLNLGTDLHRKRGQALFRKQARVTESCLLCLFSQRFCSYFQGINGNKMHCSHYIEV